MTTGERQISKVLALSDQAWEAQKEVDVARQAIIAGGLPELLEPTRSIVLSSLQMVCAEVAFRRSGAEVKP